MQQSEQANLESPLVAKGGEQLNGLTERVIRHGFIQKVYGILFAQLLVTTVVGGLVMQFCEPIMKVNPGLVMFLMFASLAVTMGIMCVFICNPKLMRSSPSNYIILFVFTVAKSVMVGLICTQYTKESVLIVFGVTALVVLSLTLFACQTSYDFTGMGPYLLAALMVLVGISMVMFLASMLGLASSPAFHTMRLVYAGFGAVLFSFFIVYDTQLIIGGKHKQRFSIDDYCMAAINLYLDIIQLFLFLLQILGNRK